MNRPRYNQRHPVASRSPASNHPTPVRITPNRSQWSSRPNPFSNRRQVAPSNINDPAQNQRPKIAIPQTAEAEFEQYFSGFFAVCCFSQAKTLIFFFILMICTQIMEDKLEAAIYTLLVLNSINGAICFLAAKMGAKMGKNISEQCGAFMKGLQCVAILVFLVSLGILTRSIDNKAANNTSAVIYIVLYALNIGNQFFLAHAIKFVNYIRQIKKCVLLMRVCVLLQLVVALIQANVNSPIPWFAAFFPLYILVLVILSSTVIMIRKAFFTHKNLFWKSDAKEKKKGLAWTLANLFALQIILLWGTLWASTVLDNPLQYSRPYLALFIVIILWCIVSLAFVKYVKQGVFKAFQALAMISDVEEDEINDTEEQNMMKYVIKVSNTYFKPATEQDIKQLKDQSASSPVTVLGEGEVEAALMRMNTEGGKCLVCCKNVSDGVFLGCGHGGICFGCGKEIVKTKKECHMCREKITGLLKVKINKKQAFYKVIQEVKNEEE